MAASDVHDPVDLPAVVAEPLTVSITNLDRGQVVEALIAGELDEDAVDAFGHQLHTLAASRQPMRLCVDLTAVDDVPVRLLDALTATAATLDGSGGELVLRNAGRAFEAIVPPERLGRSWRFERTSG